MFSTSTPVSPPPLYDLSYDSLAAPQDHDVFRYLTRNPGSRAGEIATGLRVGHDVVSAHLFRSEGRLFSSRNGRWYPIPEADPGDGSW